MNGKSCPEIPKKKNEEEIKKSGVKGGQLQPVPVATHLTPAKALPACWKLGVEGSGQHSLTGSNVIVVAAVRIIIIIAGDGDGDGDAVSSAS